MKTKILYITFLLLCLYLTEITTTEASNTDIIDVVDLRGKDLETRLLILSLQGIVNREKPSLYVLWESKYLKPTSSERWLEYYKEKGWIKDYKTITIREAVEKYRDHLQGMVIYDPDIRATINLAVSLSGIENLIIAHPDIMEYLTKLGIEVKCDLRNKFRNNIEAHEWQLENIFPKCNKSLINLFPTDEGIASYRVSIIDYIIANKACSISLNVIANEELIHEYYKQMNKFAIAIGYPESGEFERPWVSLTSKHGLLNVLATTFSPNFSFHSKMPAKKEYKQEHIFKKAKVEPNKIYIAFAVSDLGLNVMQDFYYEMWPSEKRGEIPISWWLDAITIDFCPGIVQYYYETKNPNDYFYSAHVAGRIRPSDFPYLEEYLQRGQKYLNKCSLKVVAFSNHKKKDNKVFQLYSKILGFGPEFEEEYWFINDKAWIVPRFMGNPETAYEKIKNYIESSKRRPLFIIAGIGLWYYPKVEDIIKIKEKLEKDYGNEIIFCRLDELIATIKQYNQTATKPEKIKNKYKLPLLIITFIVLPAILLTIYYKLKRQQKTKIKKSNQSQRLET